MKHIDLGTKLMPLMHATRKGSRNAVGSTGHGNSKYADFGMTSRMRAEHMRKWGRA